MPAEFTANLPVNTGQDIKVLSAADLSKIIRSSPQYEPTTEHYKCDKQYARKVACKADVLIEGKRHKKNHFLIILKGSCLVWDERVGKETYKAGDVIISLKGTKRFIHTLEECVFMTVHTTRKTSLEAIEDDLVEYDPDTLFTTGNKLNDRGLALNEVPELEVTELEPYEAQNQLEQ